MLKHALTVLAVAAIAVVSAVAAPAPAQAEVNVYTTPGRHVVNGREWSTTCSPYDTNITRCRADIKSGGKWVFNNLAYLAADRKFWFDNPLARPGIFTSGGRDWLTSCNDDWTGASACRSFIRSGGEWVFNNLVYFTRGTVDYPKFSFENETGRLTAAVTPTTQRWAVADAHLYTGAPGGSATGTIAKGAATIITQRTKSLYSEVFHNGVFSWVETKAITKVSVDPPIVPAVSVGSVAGSVPVGSASYPVPANAVFVSPGGSRSGSGTLASPYRSLAFAIEKASSGSTIVMRAGAYRESVTVPFNKRLTIQSYPKEAVWLEGSSVVTGWQRMGTAWMVSNWNHIFDHRVSHSKGVDQSDRFIDTAYPLAGFPDQVWVSGVKLRQVGSVKAVVPGTFFVDEAGRRLYVGTDPTGKQVEASTLQQGLVIHGTGTVVRGIGARRYGNTFWMGGAISAQVDNIVLENVVSSQNATIGVNGWGKKMRFDRITITESGALGLGLNKADDLVLSNSLIKANNVELFQLAPVSGGAKITTSKRVLVSGNGFDENRTAGLWFDESAYDVTVVGNRFSGNGGSGLELEWTSKALVANNYFIRNGKAGLLIMDANDISVWNNTFSANETYSVRLYQDKGRGSNPVIWLPVRDVSMKNNVVSYGTGSCQYLVHDTLNKDTGQSMRVTSQGNAYHRASSAASANMACWANGSTGLRSFKTLKDFRAATGNDLQSAFLEGSPILTSSYQLTSAAVASTGSVALPIPSAVASVMQVPANTRKLGAVTPMPT